MSDNPEKGSRRVKAPFDASVQAHIGRQLKAMYDEVVQQPVPDHLVRLLDALQPAAGAESDGAVTDSSGEGVSSASHESGKP